jgi:hypothetical protein
LTGHSARWVHERGYIRGEFTCTASAEAECHLYCPEGCDEPCSHELAVGEDCNVLAWLDDPGPEETYDGPPGPVRDGPIAFHWGGEDAESACWTYAAAANEVDVLTAQRDQARGIVIALESELHAAYALLNRR